MTQRANDTRSPVGWLAIILSVYGAAFFLPVGEGGRAYGHQMFSLGAIATASFALLPWSWPWLANMVFYVGCICLVTGRSREARQGGLIATVMALGYLPYVFGPFAAGKSELPGAGYWVWVGSMALLALAGWRESQAAHPGIATDSWKEDASVRSTHAAEDHMRRLLAQLKPPGHREQAVTAHTERDGELY
ncbi:MAG TPA: hypothetical protein VEL76_08575 [Gemmataceae bacterium]|nr:hypothetical protein [Gemmataceae bacterium]